MDKERRGRSELAFILTDSSCGAGRESGAKLRRQLAWKLSYLSSPSVLTYKVSSFQLHSVLIL